MLAMLSKSQNVRYTLVLVLFVTAFMSMPASAKVVAENELQTADGDLDTTFGTNGIVRTDFNNSIDYGYSAALQPDGRIIVAGATIIDGDTDFALARYMPDGSLDPTFDSDGKVITDFGSEFDNGYAVALQADGRILLAGTTDETTSNTTEFALARYNRDGSLDTTFDSDGQVTTLIGRGNRGYAVAVQPDGKIVMAGFTWANETHDFALVRYNGDGSLDTGFGANGIVVTDLGEHDRANTIVIQPSDGKILVAGDSYNYDNVSIALARYNSDGSLDTTFDSDGKVITSVGTWDFALDLALQLDGKILAAGSGDHLSIYRDFVLVRYNSDGLLDTTFDSDGKVVTDFGSEDDGRAVAVQPDGRIVMVGSGNALSTFALVRYQSDGSPDVNFGVDGKVNTSVGGSGSGYDVVLQTDSNIVVVGSSFNGSNLDFAVARYIGDATPRTYYVKSDARGANNGTSWENAYTDLQSALAAASSGDEIWVAAGTYKPTMGTDRTVSFSLKNGVAIYGGFAGTETLRTQRDPIANVTTLSGDIGVAGDNSDNSYHVVVGSGTNNSAILDGFTVTAGTTTQTRDFSPSSRGGGMYSYYGSPIVRNVTFINNYGEFGGGMYNGADFNPSLEPEIAAYPVLNDVIFKNNSSFEGGGLFNENHIQTTLNNVIFEGNTAIRGGGGMEDRQGFPSLTNVVFKNNSGGLAAGGMQNFSLKAALTNVTFSGNSSIMYGGGLVNSGTDPILTNVTFYGNSAEQGGGMWNSNSKPVVLTNVTFYNNSASAFGGAIYNDATYTETGSQTTLQNAILWGNTAPTGAQIYNAGTSVVTASDSVVEGGLSGGTNIITTDPKLGTFGNHGGFSETVPLLAGSSAIDTGKDSSCPATDQRGVVRLQGSHCDIGAYEVQSTIRYVKWNASGTNTGMSWANAYTDLQTALAAAFPGEQIWVAAGTYKPTSGSDRTASFALQNDVAIYGGFAGSETSLAQRDPVVNPAILSGDIGISGNATDNSFHVVSSSNLNSTAVLDGFTIRNGAADSEPDTQGGGMYNTNSSPTLHNLIFSNNSAGIGTGMYNYNSSPDLFNITFLGNTGIPGSRGGAIVNDFNSSPHLENVTFINNSGVSVGGAMLNAYNSNPRLVNVTFTGNSASISGGAIFNYGSNPTLQNVTFSGNSASAGGAIDNDNSSHTTVINGILYGDSGGEVSDSAGSTTTVTYSIVQGGYPGTGNLNADPLLGPLADNGGFTKTMAIGVTSPAVDAGDDAHCSATDQRGITRPQGSHCDIGAYEYEAAPPVSWTLTVNKIGTGSGTVTSNPAGINCGSDCSESYADNTQVTLTASPTAGSFFAGWGGACFGTGACVVSMTADKAVGVGFKLKEFAPSVQWTSDFSSAGQGWQVSKHPRLLGDVNGDGLEDVVGFFDDGVWVGLSNGSGFDAMSKWSAQFTYNQGWRVDQHARTVGDVNGDGLADLIGFGYDGVWIALSNGSSFGSSSKWSSNFTYNQGWRVDQHPRLAADVNGDWKADLIGFGYDGVWVALSNGSGFDPYSKWGTSFTYNQGWRVNQHPRLAADVNGDWMADLIGFGYDGVWVALSNGSGFAPYSKWGTSFTYNQGWRIAQHPRLAGDVSGDGKADLIGFGYDGVWVALSNGSSFDPYSKWSSSFTYNQGWRVDQHPRLAGDVSGDISGDGQADLVGFGNNGVWVAAAK